MTLPVLFTKGQGGGALYGGGESRIDVCRYGNAVYSVVHSVGSPYDLEVRKNSDPQTGSSAEVDAGNGPVVYAAGVGSHIAYVSDGTYIHIVTIDNGSGVVYYAKFSMATDTWQNVDGTNKKITIYTYTNIPNSLGADIRVRSDGDVIVFYSGETPSVMGGPSQQVAYSRLESGTWTNGVVVADAATKNVNYFPRGILAGPSDQMIFIYEQDSSATVYLRGLSSANSLRTQRTLMTSLPGIMGFYEVTQSGTLYCGIGYIASNALVLKYFVGFSDDSSPTINTRTTTEGGITAAPSAGNLSFAVDTSLTNNELIYVADRSADANLDLYRDGGSLASMARGTASFAAGGTVPMASVYVRGSDVLLGFVYSSGTVYYNEYTLRVLGVTAATQTGAVTVAGVAPTVSASATCATTTGAVSVTGYAPVVNQVLTNLLHAGGQESAGTSSYVTSSITVTSGRPVVVWICISYTAVNNSLTGVSVSGASQTWNQAGAGDWAANDYGQNWCFTSDATSGGSGTLTVTTSGNHDAISVLVYELLNADGYAFGTGAFGTGVVTPRETAPSESTVNVAASDYILGHVGFFDFTKALTSITPRSTWTEIGEHWIEKTGASWEIGTHAQISPKGGDASDTISVTFDEAQSWQFFKLPLESVAGNVSRTPGTGTVSVAGVAPTVSADASTSFLVGAVAVAGVAPTFAGHHTAAPTTGTVAVDGVAPTVAASSSPATTTGAVAVDGLAAASAAHHTAATITGTVAVDGVAPTVAASSSPATTTGTVAVDGVAPTVATTQDAAANTTTGTVAVDGQIPAVSTGTSVTAATTTGAVAVDGLAAASAAHHTASTVTGVVTVDGLAPTLAAASTTDTTTGTVAVDGLAPTFAANFDAAPTTGTVAVDGVAPTLVASSTADSATGTVSVDGQNPAVSTDSSTTAATATGTVAVDGVAPTVVASSTTNTATGAVTVDGLAPTVATTQDFTAASSAGAVAVDGLAPTVDAGTDATADTATGTVAVAGEAPALVTSSTTDTTTGTIAVDGLAPTVATTGDVTVNTASGAVTVDGLTPAAAANFDAAPTVGAVTVVGLAPAFAANFTAATQTGTVTCVGNTPTVIVGGVGVQRPVYVGGKAVAYAGFTNTRQTLSLTDLTGGVASQPSLGDIIIVAYGTADNANRTLSIWDNSNREYELVAAQLYVNVTNDTNLRFAYKALKEQAETSVSIGPTQNTASAGAVAVHVWRNVDLSVPLSGVLSSTSTAASLPNPPAITPTRDNSVVLAVGFASLSVADTNAFTSSDLSNFVTVFSPDTRDGIVGMGSYDWSSGQFDPATFGNATSTSSATYGAYSVALRGQLASGTEAITSPAVGTVAVSGLAPNLGLGSSIDTATGVVDIMGYMPDAQGGTDASVTTDVGTVSVLGYAPQVPTIYVLDAASGSYAVVGNAATLARTWNIPLPSGTYEVTGYPAGLYVGDNSAIDEDVVTVPAEVRTMVLPPEDRVMVVPAGNRDLEAGGVQDMTA